MSYTGTICRLGEVQKHPSADKLRLASACGHLIVVGAESANGDLGVLFPPDGQLSDQMCRENKLWRKDPSTGEPMGGYLEGNARVRAIRLRGICSEGLWLPISSLAWTGTDPNSLAPGEAVSVLNGNEVCRKYLTPATARAMGKVSVGKGRKSKASRIRYPHFRENVKVEQLRHHIRDLETGSILWISLKLHGTSGRTGFSLVSQKKTFLQRVKLALATVLKGPQPPEYKVVSGTRRTLLSSDPGAVGPKAEGYRHRWHAYLSELPLVHGETLYYEIVGYTDAARPIMGIYGDRGEREISRAYGDNIVFSYGCDLAGPGPLNKMLVYRITRTSHDGTPTELSWQDTRRRCQELRLEAVPLLAGPLVYDGNPNPLIDLCKELDSGPDPLDPRHPREGVVVRAEGQGGVRFYKVKGIQFCVLEDIRKQDPEYVDQEEIA